MFTERKINMQNIYAASPAEFLKNTKIPTRVMPTEASMYEEIAQIMVDTIVQNGANKTVIICPVGPIGQYPIFAEKVNAQNISLKNCWFINMDEYLNDDDTPIAYEDPLSFHATMDRVLYSKIKPELLMPKEQRLFPEPGSEAELDALLERLGPPDLCLTGVGVNGHVAFNEPPAKDEPITDAQFKSIGTRCLNIATETVVNNGVHKIRGALDLFPKRCISLGMRQLLASKVFKVYLYCDWQWGIMRKIALENASRFAPASFLQMHPNAEMVVTQDLADFELYK